jgi:lysophospholipase L1-like esterase
LPPPPSSGVDFPKDGIVVVSDDDEVDSDTHAAFDENCPDKATKKVNEFRLVLIGDSPVEGIGNNQHSTALCGETASAFARRVCHKGSYDCVRYWSFGKSGLTAGGIETEMVPLLHSTADLVNATADTTYKPTIHVIVLLCGVNNVLSSSTPSSFATEVSSLLAAIRRHPSLQQTPIILLGLPDFSRLPFLPAWPMGWILGLKGKRLQQKLEDVVEQIQRNADSIDVVLVQIPEVQDVIGSRGYIRLDSSNIGEETIATGSGRFVSRFCHPLLKHLGHKAINPSTVTYLGIDDFLCNDGFHPGRYGVSISAKY